MDLSPHLAKEPTLAAGDSAAKAFKLIARSALGQVSANAAVLARARRPEAVHQLRVGLRRLRAALSLFKPMLADREVAAVRSELKWMTGELGPARDLDVFMSESFRPLLEPHRDWPDLADLGHALREARTKAYDRAQAAATSARFGALLQTSPPGSRRATGSPTPIPSRPPCARAPISRLAPELLDKARRTVIRRGRKLEKLAPEDAPQAAHPRQAAALRRRLLR